MGKRVIHSVLGIPLIFIVAVLILVILQAGWDYLVGDRTPFRLILLLGSSISLTLLIIFSMIKKRTVARVFTNQMGVR